MRVSLYVKVLFGYLIFGILGFITIAFFSSNMTLQYLERDRADQLYNEASLIAGNCRQKYSGSNINFESLGPQLSSIGSYFDADIWIVEKQGKIVYRSDGLPVGTSIEGFDPSEQGRGRYVIGHYYELFEDSVLSVTAPISANFSTYGYVVLHQSVSGICDVRDRILNIIYITFLVVFAISLVILWIFRIYIFQPIKQITAAANEFASGNLKYNLKLHSEDEIGYLADTLNYMAHELNNKEEDQRKFISNVSHDFRSPLTSIKGYLEAMIDGTIPPELYEKYMKLVISEADRLTKLTSSTLALQSLDSMGNLLDITTFDINQVIRDTVAAFEGICKPKNLNFDLIFAERCFFVQADMGKIQQVLYNLADNAIKFSRPNTTIWIETYERHEKIFISVKDSGVGISKDSLKKIWSRFYKSDASRGKDKSGTGLGLSITKEIITAHNENIDVISTEGIGTEFIFTLPKGSPVKS
ncbi:HAMP domain-containing histidine kinase [Lacrimispora sp. NSJ-141]|uniref:histidine kinase n=1 Tax=Lientehia hominis TaxID=2897778 RepID=A0AAP2RJ54_9FIRM|nr:HAMP domain-containing sensor histidine kinase [Lientehia hominis]MCD2493142.1 HAMP domain-containing histidine kinase [Lientehia hominis]